VPGVPGVPGVPRVPRVPGVPGVPGVPRVPGVPGVPKVLRVPKVSGVPKGLGGGGRLVVTITDGRGHSVSAPGLAAWLRRVAPGRARGEIAIALVSDTRIRAFNQEYRGKSRATDVLSFPAAERGAPPRLPREAQPLGDIVIATGVARRQAAAAGHSYEAELKVLALHGLLHLLGYDHDDPGDGGRMARLETRLRFRGGLRSGLIERARRRRA
jgi:probable rRNA maturation factor